MKPIGPMPKNIYRDVHLPLKVLKRLRKLRWVHYHRLGTNVRNSDSPISTVCGKPNGHRLFCGPAITNDLTSVTCPRCIEVLKKSHWYCCKHGFIDDENVTFEETCEFCGMPV